jgi:hypothetical protein
VNITTTFSCMPIVFFDHIHPPITLSWSPPLFCCCFSSSQVVHLLHSCIFYKSRYHIWEKICSICLFFLFLEENRVSCHVWSAYFLASSQRSFQLRRKLTEARRSLKNVTYFFSISFSKQYKWHCISFLQSMSQQIVFDRLWDTYSKYTFWGWSDE